MFLFLGIMTAYLVTTLSWPKSKHPSLSIIHWVASLLPFSASTVYHLFMCHSKGSTLYHKLLSLDMIGIWAVNTFGYIIAIFTTFHCMPSLQILAVASYISFSFLALCFLVKAKTPFQRFLPLCYYLVVRPMIMLSRLYINKLKVHRNALAVWQYVLLDGFALFGAMVNVAKFPERYIPGKVDFALNSHQIMHIFTIASMYLLNTAAEHDFQFLTDTVC